MMSAELPAPVPAVDPETQVFWDATAEGRLLLSYCKVCQQAFWYPRSHCPDCGTDQVEWLEASGRGTIYSYTPQTRIGGDYSSVDELILAYVELDEGPMVMTNIVDFDPDQLTIGQAVEVTFHDTGEGSALYRFRPVNPA
jgi:hypothetical protein